MDRELSSQGSRRASTRPGGLVREGLEPSKNLEAIPSGDGLSSRPFTAISATELEAIQQTNKIFDRWLRNIVTRQSEAPRSPSRPALKNGQPAAPRIRDINWQIAIHSGAVLKEKPMPLELLTQRSFYDGAPYRHLQMLVVNQDIREWYSRFVLKTQSVQTYGQITGHNLQSMTFVDCKVAIDFSRHHLTHLDPVVFRDDNLPLELFLDYDEWIKGLAKEIKELRVGAELRAPHEMPGIPARTDCFLIGGGRRSMEVLVQDFDPQ
jgi:hypothetical protein